MRKKKIENHVLNMKAILAKYKNLAEKSPDMALKYFFTMMVTEIARIEEDNKSEYKLSDKEAEIRLEKLESYIADAFDMTFGGLTAPSEVSTMSHVGYL